MGCYVNPKDMSKEQWLAENGKEIEPTKTWDFSSDTLPVCLVRNSAFSAAAVGYQQGELEDFNDPADNRPTTWYEVSKAKLYEASDLKKWEK
jgi:hypothetical protein